MPAILTTPDEWNTWLSAPSLPTALCSLVYITNAEYVPYLPHFEQIPTGVWRGTMRPLYRKLRRVKSRKDSVHEGLGKMKLRGLSIAISILVAAGSSAFAADMTPSDSSWTGFYVGAQAGYGFGKYTDALYCSIFGGNIGSVSVPTGSGPADCTNPTPVAYTGLSNQYAGPWDTVDDFSQLNGWLAGARMGYNYQFDRLVVGAELAGSITGMRDHGASYVDLTFGGGGGGPSQYYEANVNVNWLVTATAKVGFAVTDDLLLSANGGLAFVNTHFESSAGYSDGGTNTGWTAGLGAEYKISDAVSLTADYRFVQVNDIEYRGSSLFGLIDNRHQYDLNFSTATVGLNYRF